MIRNHLRRLTLPALAVLLATAAPVRAAKETPPPPEVEAIDLPLQPGRRSVQRLLVLDDGSVCGVVLGPKDRLGYFRYTPSTHKVERLDAMPPGGVEPRELADPDSGFTWDPTGKAAYSISPAGRLLKHTGEGDARRSDDLGQLAGTRPFESKPPAAVEGYQRSHTMFFDSGGNLYTAGKDGYLFRYSPSTGKLDQLSVRLPAVLGREPWASLDAAAIGPDQLVYGGTFDGYLFTFDPKSLAVVNLGKPLRQQRILGLAFREGKLFGVGGEDEGLPRSFTFDPATRGFALGGPLQPPANPGHGPDSLETLTMAVDAHGVIYLGTTGRLGNLYTWAPR